MKKKGIVLGLIAAGTLLAATVVGTTLARIHDTTYPLTNTFDLGSVDTVIEEGHEDFKNPMVTNIGESDCLVRARVMISPAEVAECVEIVYPDEPKWTLGTDGYYYYDDILEPGETTEAIFKTLTIKNQEKWDQLKDKEFDVTVYQESVQAVVYANGEEITEPSDIWMIYEAESAQNAE